MKRIFAFSLVLVLASNVYGAEVLDLNTALQNTYKACADIDDNLHELKVLAGVNTAVTAVGTGLGVGATATGFAKAATDKKIEDLEEQLKKYIVENEGLDIMPDDPDKFIKDLESYLKKASSEKKKEAESLKELEQKSKKLGNWRTGLLAGNTATNIAGAVIASKTINKDDIKGQIDACVSATQALNTAITAAKLNGEDIEEAQNIYKACREYEFVDISSINKRGKGAMISSSVGAVVGGVGTITSGVANSDKIRDDNTDAGKKKEKDLNTASNVLSVGATAASATATVFNATQIAAIKKVAKVSESCTGVLK